MEMTTYDYDNQRWVTGPAARELRLKQIAETLELLRGSRGEEYARFTGKDRARMIQDAEREQSQI